MMKAERPPAQQYVGIRMSKLNDKYMNKQETIQKIKTLFATWLTDPAAPLTKENLVEIEIIIKNYVAEHPKDTDMWLRLALLHMHYFLRGYQPVYTQSLACIYTILSYDPHNNDAVLLLAFIENQSFGENRDFGQVQESTFEALCALGINDQEILSLIEYAKSFYYIHTDTEKYVMHLIKSIEYCDTHVNNFLVLGRYYLKKREFVQAKQFLHKALHNIQAIYDVDYIQTDITDIQEFFNYYYKGIHRTIAGGFIIGNSTKLRELIKN